MNVFLRWIRACGLGALAGLAALALDVALASVAGGPPPSLAIRLVVVCLVTGAAAGIATAAGAGAMRRPAADGLVFGAALAGLYAFPVGERTFQVARGLLGSGLAALLVVAGFAAALAWVLLLRRLSGSTIRALFLAALTVAVGLAINRHWVVLPMSPSALLADGAVLAVGAALARGLRGAVRRGERVAVAIVAAVVSLAFAAALGIRWPRAAASDRPPGARPDLVLVVVDTLRQDVFEAVVAETPEGRGFGRRLADAAWFDHAVAAAPWTAPSVASMMTGLYPSEHGFGLGDPRDGSRPLRRLADSVPTLAETLREAGYATVALVANPHLHRDSGIDRGFERYELLGGTVHRLPLLTGLKRAGLLRDDVYQDAARVRRRLGSVVDALAGRRAPYFLWIQLLDPHAPLRPHDDLAEDPAGDGLPADERLYRDEVRFALRELGAMLDLLDARLDARRRAVQVVVSDHGEMFPSDDVGEPFHPRGVGHGHAFYRPLMRVPLVIRPPRGLPPRDAETPRRIDALVSHVDLHATVLDLLGLGRGRLGQGRISLAPWLGKDGQRVRRRRQALLSGLGTTFDPERRAIETRRYKLILYPRGSRTTPELFDVVADPDERRNLAPSEPLTVARLRRALDRLWEAQQDAPETRPVELDEGLRERLRALGYLDGG